MIRLVSPVLIYKNHHAELDKAFNRVMCSGNYILGTEVVSFEAEFSRYIGVKNGIGVASGTDAIELALRAFGIGAGDAVFTASHTAVATVTAITRTGAIPVLLDVDSSYCLDPNDLKQAIERFDQVDLRPAAVIPIHLYGHAANLGQILDIAKKNNLALIEDCAQAHGCKYQGAAVGSFGDASAFSFYPTKNLGGFGDGGMVLTNDDSIAKKIRQLQQYGWKKRYVSSEVGMNSRLDELQAALLRERLLKLDDENAKRAHFAEIYHERLAALPIELPSPKEYTDPVYHLYVIATDRRDELQAHLSRKGISTAIHYPVPIHQQPAYDKMLPCCSRFHHTEAICGKILSLPMHPYLTENEVEKVCYEIEEWVKYGQR